MPHVGSLDRLRTTITVEGSDTAVSIVQVNERGGVHETSLTSRVNHAAVFDELIGPRIVHLRVEVRPPLNGIAKLTLDQGTKRVVDMVEVNADTEFTFDFDFA